MKKNEIALEGSDQEQYIKTNEIHIDAMDFEKIVALLGVIINPIDFTSKFKIVLNYNPNNRKVELNYFKYENRLNLLPDMNEDKRKGNIVYLTGEPKERAHIGIEIIDKFYKEINLKETISNSRGMLNIIEFIKSKKENCDIDDVIDIIMYAQSYAANVKDWKST